MHVLMYFRLTFLFDKIESVIRRILWITMKDQGAKILAFSSWNDVLDVLGHALAANNITFVRMKGGRYNLWHCQFQGFLKVVYVLVTSGFLSTVFYS